MSRHADVQFSHGICPDCYAKVVAEEFGELAGVEPPPAEQPETAPD